LAQKPRGAASEEAMFRFLLLVIVLAGAALALTNPSTDDVQAKLDSNLLSQLGAGGGGLTSMLGGQSQMKITLERTNYYILSTYKVKLGAQTLPGCIIGIAQQAVPYDKC
jgi:hypothetical protein